MWCGPDDGLIRCWERGREMRAAEEVYPAGDPNAAPDFKGADEGELIRLPWKNGIKVKDRPQSQLFAPLQYLAMWQDSGETI